MSQEHADGEFEPATGRSRIRWETHVKPILKYVGLAFYVVIMLGPVYWTFQNSLKSPDQIFTQPIGIPWVTFDPVLGQSSAWVQMWTEFPFLQYLLATSVASLATAVLATSAAVFAAYAYARLELPFKSGLFLLSVSGFIFPIVLIAIPIYVVMESVNLLNTYAGLTFAFTAFTLPYTVWLLRGFFEDLPENLEQAARVDGCTKVGAFFRVILPLSRPAIVSVFLLAFLLSWHNFIMAFMLNQDTWHKTLAVGIVELHGSFYVTNMHYIMAATFLTIIVPMVLYMYLQKYLVEGLATGSGVKG